MFSNPAHLFPSFNAVQSTTYFKDALKNYLPTETYKSHESVYNSFLDAQIKGTKYSF